MKKKRKMKKKMKEIVSESLQEFKEPKVSLFENCYMTSPINRIPITDFLLTDKYKNQVETYRKSRDPRVRDKIKQNLECITPSGAFGIRQECYLATHSGLICVDVDSKHNQEIDLKMSKDLIGKKNPSLYYAGLSIGGEGIFLIFRISNPELHKQHFHALAYYLKDRFNLNVDRAVQNPVSLRIASYDSHPYYNPNPEMFKLVMDIQNSPMPIVQKPETRESVKNAISIIKRNRIDITNGYGNWFKIGSALAYEFGEEGREWFHTVSAMYKSYNKCECDFQYDKCLRYKKGNVKIGTFFYYCRQYGIKY